MRLHVLESLCKFESWYILHRYHREVRGAAVRLR